VAWKNLFAAFDRALRLLHPFMPFLTEELWHQLPQRPDDKSIALNGYPKDQPQHDGDFFAGGRANEFARVQELITHVRNIRAELKLDPRKKVAAELYSSFTDIREGFARNREAILRLAILSDLKVSADRLPQEGAAVRSTSQFDLRIAFAADTVDVAGESARLRKEIEGLEKAIASKEKQLGDVTFRSRAPEKIVRTMEATLTEQRLELQKLRKRLEELDKDA
jgi:valyl-tRNA synthetase